MLCLTYVNSSEGAISHLFAGYVKNIEYLHVLSDLRLREIILHIGSSFSLHAVLLQNESIHHAYLCSLTIAVIVVQNLKENFEIRNRLDHLF